MIFFPRKAPAASFLSGRRRFFILKLYQLFSFVLILNNICRGTKPKKSQKLFRQCVPLLRQFCLVPVDDNQTPVIPEHLLSQSLRQRAKGKQGAVIQGLSRYIQGDFLIIDRHFVTSNHDDNLGVRQCQSNGLGFLVPFHLSVQAFRDETDGKQVGNVTVPEARIIQIAPWEKSLIKEIEKAIMTSDIGINPSNDGSVIRLVFPELTEERRKDLVKEVKKKGEEGKVAIRNIRRDGNDAFKKLAKTEVSEDEIKGLEDDLQKLTDKYVKDIDALIDSKSKEIMTV